VRISFEAARPDNAPHRIAQPRPVNGEARRIAPVSARTPARIVNRPATVPPHRPIEAAPSTAANQVRRRDSKVGADNRAVHPLPAQAAAGADPRRTAAGRRAAAEEDDVDSVGRHTDDVRHTDRNEPGRMDFLLRTIVGKSYRANNRFNDYNR
jgi:hypothetical protein